jgi:AraC family ethanolamine operon transcriptional activator
VTSDVEPERVRRTHATEGDEFMLAVPGVAGQVVRTGPGDHARVTATQVGDIPVARLELNFAAAAEAQATGDWLVVATMLRASAAGSWEGVSLAAGQSFVYPAGTRHHAANPAGLDFVMTVVPQDRFERAAADLGFAPGPDGTKRMVRGGPMWTTAAQLADGTAASVGGLHVAMSGDVVLDSVIRTVCSRRPEREGSRRRWDDTELIEDATSFIDQYDGWMVPMITLCRHVGVSERRLQLAFAHLLGIGPLAYMRHRALQSAHRMLRDASPGSIRVAEVARTHGFGHHGRFASFYASVYGESPSTSLARH